ncbi:serine protease [Kitasatospora sp. NPDC127059]|uniref:S1 family peptidase n=1 Tax=unclassified Kitasatospora TaxID=2633591 RepID=UPI00365CA0CB
MKQIFLSTVRIEVEKDGEDFPYSEGTGFIYSATLGPEKTPALVTNWHVIQGAFRISFSFHVRADDGSVILGQSCTVNLENPFNQNSNLRPVRHPNLDVDLAVLPIGWALNGLESMGHKPFTVMLDSSNCPPVDVVEDLDPGESVIFVGYPDGLYDRKHNTPIFRSGIAATPILLDWCGRPQFLVDASVFPGSSGSPVFLVQNPPYRSGQNLILGGGTRVFFLGVMTWVMDTPMHAEVEVARIPRVDVRQPIGLGIVQKWTTIEENIDEMCRVLNLSRGEAGKVAPDPGAVTTQEAPAELN